MVALTVATDSKLGSIWCNKTNFILVTEITKNTFGIWAGIIMIILLLYYSSVVIAGYYASAYGQLAYAKVIDVSELCKHKNKYLTLSIDGKAERIRVYGLSCRVDDFPLNAWIKVRKEQRLGIITLPNNSPTPRFFLFPLLTVILVIALKGLIKHRKKLKSFS
jgi:hypothetical protein